MWYLFWRLLRLRSDAIFFHASALGIYGEGTIFVGPGGAGKSTTALGLTARGHNFLSDEVAGYLPATGELVPFRRPVGIKPGPRASAVERSLTPAIVERIQRDGFIRVDVDTLFPCTRPVQFPFAVSFSCADLLNARRSSASHRGAGRSWNCNLS